MTGYPTASQTRNALATVTLIAAALGSAAGSLSAQRAVDMDILSLQAGTIRSGLPDDWETRAVRGHRLPMSRIVDSSGAPYMRISGAGQAGWFFRDVSRAPALVSGRLQWTWRAPNSPDGADIARPDTDDAAMRVFVVFGARRSLLRRPRVLFYTLGDGDPPRVLRNPAIGVRVAGRPALTRDWVMVSVDPIADFRSIWGHDPPPITAIGIMQDSDQTQRAAVADIHSLVWRVGHATTR
jgi:Protein of unknown function (DUF3047)